MKSNFEFLEQDFPILAKAGALAEKYCVDDPNSALFKLGTIGETVVNLIFEYDRLEPPSENTAAARIVALRRKDILPRDVADILHALRKARNLAVHQNYESAAEARIFLQTTVSVCEWFAATYGSTPFERRDFVPPEELAERRKQDAAPEPVEPTKDEAEREETEAEERARTAPRVAFAERLERSEKADETRSRSEAEVRVLIDERLRRVGWEVDSQKMRYSNGFRPEKGKNRAIAEWPVGSGETSGTADYALFIGEKLYAVVEAKAETKNPVAALDGQAKEYAAAIRAEDASATLGVWENAGRRFRVPFVFASNGRPFCERLREKSGVWFQDLRSETAAPKPLRGWISPDGLKELFQRDVAAADRRLIETETDVYRNILSASYLAQAFNLRYYQLDAIRAAERAVLDGKRAILLAMATGTGKTRTVLGLLYRFLKAKRFRRVLFVVDRNELADQALDALKDVWPEEGRSFDSIYNVGDLDDDANKGEKGEKNAKNVVPKERNICVATVQSLVKRVLYDSDETSPSVSDFDLIVVDEAHRGYTLDKERSEDELEYRDQRDFQSKYRAAIDYFDATKIALTATPALHTTQIFGTPVFKYSFRQGVVDGFLCDYDPPHLIETELSREGIHWRKGDVARKCDKETDEVFGEELEDDLDFDVADFNRRVVAENFNREVLEEIARTLDPTDKNKGKTLIFAVDNPHADRVVAILREICAKNGWPTDAVAKITSEIGDKKVVKEAIRRFKNEDYPNIVVTVDLLSTGVDVPKITKLVYLRRIKSRILFEQTIGRATRLCPKINKERFEIFDAVGVFDALEPINSMKPVVARPKTTFADLCAGLETFVAGTEIDDQKLRRQVEEVVARLRRKARRADEAAQKANERLKLATDGRDAAEFATEIARLAVENPKEAAQKLLDLRASLEAFDVAAKRDQAFYLSDAPDRVVSHTRGYGADASQRPEDYLEAFSRYVEENRDRVEALTIVCSRPRELTVKDLKSLCLTLDDAGFVESRLNAAFAETQGRDAATVAADIVGWIRRFAVGSPLISRAERVDRAFARLRAERAFSDAEEKWLVKFADHLKNNGALTLETFDEPTFKKQGGSFARLDKIFNGSLAQIVERLGEYLYDDGGKAI
ncbi:MAG: type I restriction-modification system endonuclease [Thermoguttaceae bacterium]|nr:type I restriction-modification system endonuclease [Thermoguttaceae bacterium]MBR4103141.1 type I restriction-modification system endonuclease [Thermoguttaceae bacterium]